MPYMAQMRIAEAAELLGVSDDTVRRWLDSGRLASGGGSGRRTVDAASVAALMAEQAHIAPAPVPQSARNRFPGIVTRIERDGVAAVVEVMAGPHRLVSLLTAEAIDDLGLEVGREAVCVVKATNVIVEIPSGREPRS